METSIAPYYRSIEVTTPECTLSLMTPHFGRSVTMNSAVDAIQYVDDEGSFYGIDELFSVITDASLRRKLMLHLKLSMKQVSKAFIAEGYEPVKVPYHLTDAYEMFRRDAAEAIRIPSTGGPPVGVEIEKLPWHSTKIGSLTPPDCEASTYEYASDLVRFRHTNGSLLTLNQALSASTSSALVSIILSNYCATMDVVGSRAHSGDLPMLDAQMCILEAVDQMFLAMDPYTPWRPKS